MRWKVDWTCDSGCADFVSLHTLGVAVTHASLSDAPPNKFLGLASWTCVESFLWSVMYALLSVKRHFSATRDRPHNTKVPA